MGRRRSYTPLNVFIGARHVGVFTRESSGAHRFDYDEEWQSWEHHFPISLSLPVRADRYSGESVINVFDNLLPDREEIRRHVAERVGAAGTDPYSLLTSIGRDCIGALQFIPDSEEQGPVGKINGTKLSATEIGDRLKNLGKAPLGMSNDSAFRISIAGAQEKTALLFHEREWLEPHGTTPTTHIIKPQIGKLGGYDLSDSVENEYFCLQLLKAFGLSVANTEILTFGDIKALVIERFDRLLTSDNRLIRLPQEDMCQALSVPSTQKYQDKGGPGIGAISNLLIGSDRPERDRLDFMKTNILFWLMGAVDGHAKNFSIFLRPGGTFEMTPLYDVLTVQPSFDRHLFERKQYCMSMKVGERGRYRVFDIRGKDFIHTGKRAGYSRKQMDDIMQSILENWEVAFDAAAEATKEQVPSEMIDTTRAGFLSRLDRLREL
jgi:serine/threonine-protein kinase HipA